MILFKKKRVELGKGHINAYVLFESKHLFSIILYNWKTIEQNRFHTHAFSAIAFLLKGGYVEEKIIDRKIVINNVNNKFIPRYLPKNYCHRILKAEPKTWTIIFVGPWIKYWYEYFQDSKKWIRYTWGRKKISEYQGDETDIHFSKQ